MEKEQANKTEEKITFKLRKALYDDLILMAGKRGITKSELIREYIEKGLAVSKTREDIDFIRKQIREELEIVLEKRLSWINAMYYKIAIHVIPLTHFTAQIIYKNIKLDDNEFREFQEFWDRAKQEARNFMSNKSTVNKTVEEVHIQNEKMYGRK